MSASPPRDSATPHATAAKSEMIITVHPPCDPTAASEPTAVEPVIEDDSNAKPSARGLHILRDADGTEKKFGSALGLLTRQFVDLLQVRRTSPSLRSCILLDPCFLTPD